MTSHNLKISIVMDAIDRIKIVQLDIDKNKTKSQGMTFKATLKVFEEEK